MHEYVPLHIHTDYETGESLAPVVELVKKAKDLGYQALAITGRNVMTGALLFETRCREQGIKPILGCEVAIAWKNDLDHFRLILLAETQEGYANLIRLSSCLHQPEFAQGLPLPKLEEHKAGLIAIIPLAVAKRGGRFPAKLAEIFAADNLFYETSPMKKPGQRQDCAYGQPVCSHAVRYLNRQDEAVFRKISTGYFDDEIKRAHLPTINEIETWQKLCPEAVANSWRIAERCNATATLRFTEADWPEFRDSEDAVAEVRAVCLQEIPRLYPNQQHIAIARLDEELQMVRETGLLYYLLILADVGAFVRQQGILAYPNWVTETGSIFYYLLGLSPVDPIRFNLPPPDSFVSSPQNRTPGITIKTGFAGRMKLNDYLQQKYAGRLAVTTLTMRRVVRNALLKAAEATKFDLQQAEKIIRKIYLFPQGAEDLPPLQEVWNESHPMHGFVNSNRRIRKLFTVAASLCMTAFSWKYLRNCLVLGPQNLSELVPLGRADHRKQLTVQYRSHRLQQQGLLLIGLWEGEAPTTIEETLLLIRANGKPVPNVRDIPLDEPSIIAEAEEYVEMQGPCMKTMVVGEAVEKIWLSWFAHHYPDEYELARQRTREIKFRSQDGV